MPGSPCLSKKRSSVGPYFLILSGLSLGKPCLPVNGLTGPWSMSHRCPEPRWFVRDPISLARDNILRMQKVRLTCSMVNGNSGSSISLGLTSVASCATSAHSGLSSVAHGQPRLWRKSDQTTGFNWPLDEPGCGLETRCELTVWGKVYIVLHLAPINSYINSELMVMVESHVPWNWLNSETIYNLFFLYYIKQKIITLDS